MATVRADWKMPAKPIETCPECSHSVEATALCEDGWELFWCCELCGDSIGEPIDWPFEITDMANDADLEALGFVVV